MKILPLILACTLMCAMHPLCGSERLDRNYVTRLVGNIRIVDRDYISAGDHGLSVEEVIDALRNVDSRRTDRVLIRLRDEATIQKYISLLRETEGRNNSVNSVLALSYSPWVIPKLIEFLEVDEIAQQPIPTNVLHPGFSGTSAGTIRYILTRSPEFSDEVRRWSGDSLATGGIEGLREFRDELLIWWEENAEHFENEDYHLVRPVSRVLGEDVEAAVEQDEENGPPTGPNDGDGG